MSTVKHYAPFALRAAWLASAAAAPIYVLARCAIALAA